MKDQHKTKTQLIGELTELRQRVADLEKLRDEQRLAEGALRGSRERLDLALNSSNGGLWDLEFSPTDSTETISDQIYLSPVLKRFIGYDNDEFPNSITGWKSRILLEDLIRVNKAAQDHLEGKTDLYEAQYRIRHKDGSIRWIYTRGKILRDEHGKPLRWVGIDWDITEQKRSEEALRESESLYRRLVEGSPDIVWSFSDRRGTVYVSGRVESILGYSPDYLYRNPWLWNESIHPNDRDHVAQAIRSFAAGKELNVEYRIKDSSGNWRWFHDRSIGVDVKDGEFIIEGISRDITERKQAEEALRETNQTLQALIQASPLAIVAVDSHKNILIWNPAAERIFGWTEQEVLGKPTPIIPKEEEEKFRELFQKVLEGKTISGLEIRWQKKDGTLIDVSLSTAPLYGENLQIWGSIAILEDIAKRKNREKERHKLLEQLRTGRERLQELSRRLVEVQETERRDLARELHDEVGQNLTALSINLNIIQNLISGESASKATDRINDSQRLVEETVVCIRDVMARLRPPVLDDYGLVAALNWYSGQFMKRNGIPTVLILKGEELAHRLPLGTETAMFRIAQEALNNVAKHAKASQITLVLENRDKTVLMVIEDNGSGFDPVAHHQNGAKPEWGLINMRERAESVGGQFKIETTPGKGTKIIVEVPRKR